MELHQQIKDTIQKHQKKIELTQWAITAGISTLIYSEYLSRIKQKQHPVYMIMVPAIRNVQEYLQPEGSMFQTLSEKLIDGMTHTSLFQKYKNAPELEMFLPDNIEIMKTIFDLYIIPNISRRVPETIARKFNLFDEEQQLFRESRDLDLFERAPFHDEQLKYVIEESVLQLFLLMPTMKKEIEFPEENRGIFMTESEILTVGNKNDISPISFNNEIINLPNIMTLMEFVTNTDIQINDHTVNPLYKKYSDYYREEVNYIVSSAIFNRVYLTRFTGIAEDRKDE